MRTRSPNRFLIPHRVVLASAALVLLAVPLAPHPHRAALVLLGLGVALAGLVLAAVHELGLPARPRPRPPRRLLGAGAWLAGLGLTAWTCWTVVPPGAPRLAVFLAGSWGAVALGTRLARPPRRAAPPEEAPRLAA